MAPKRSLQNEQSHDGSEQSKGQAVIIEFINEKPKKSKPTKGTYETGASR